MELEYGERFLSVEQEESSGEEAAASFSWGLSVPQPLTRLALGVRADGSWRGTGLLGPVLLVGALPQKFKRCRLRPNRRPLELQ